MTPEGFEPPLLDFQSNVLPIKLQGHVFFDFKTNKVLEGLEPPSQVYQTCILTTILQDQKEKDVDRIRTCASRRTDV